MAMDAETKRQMDMAAEEARTVLKQLDLDKNTTEKIRNWFKEYYLAAGYKRLAKILMSSLLFLGCAGAPVCSIDNIYVYDAGICLEAYAEAMDEEECFTDTCVEMDEMAYHQATGRVWE